MSTEILVFILSVSFTIIYAITWSVRDFYIIKNDNGWNDWSRKWHNWGLVQASLAFIPVAFWLFVWDSELAVNLGFIMALLLWQLHDSILGWMFYRRVFYLGNNGWDRWLEGVFQSAGTLSFIRIGIAATFIYDYFREVL